MEFDVVFKTSERNEFMLTMEKQKTLQLEIRREPKCNERDISAF